MVQHELTYTAVWICDTLNARFNVAQAEPVKPHALLE